MKKIYFLGGLGSNAHYSKDLEEALGRPIQYVDLPGHGQAKHLVWSSLDEVTHWFSEQLAPEEQILLIGHSLGADVAVFLAQQCPNVGGLVLLDGGFIQLSQLLTVDEEIADLRTHLQTYRFASLQEALQTERENSLRWSDHLEKAARANWRYLEDQKQWVLDLAEEGLISLVKRRREMEGGLAKLSVPTLLIASDLQGNSPDWRQEMLREASEWVEVLHIPHSSHSLHTDCPADVAALIRERWPD